MAAWGLTLHDVAALHQEIGRAALPEPLITVPLLAARALVLGSNPTLKAQHLAALLGGERLATLAWQGVPGALGTRDIAPIASRKQGGWTIAGTARFIALPHAAFFVVAARAEEGAVLLWLEHDATWNMECATAVDGAPVGSVYFNGVAVTEDAVIARPEEGGKILEAILDHARLAVCAELLGAMEQTFSMTLAYLKQRQQFGVAIGSFQALQHRAVELYVQIELSRSASHRALRCCEQSTDPHERAAAVSGAKSRCADAALLVAKDCIQPPGAIGYTEEYDLSIFVRRILALSGSLGNATAHRAPRSAPQRKRTRTMSSDYNALSEANFRDMLRTFITAECPSNLLNQARRIRWVEAKPWCLKLAARGWNAPAWPGEFGGMELNTAKLLVYYDEFEAADVARTPDLGFAMLGPLLIRYGTQEQRRHYLPRILSCDDLWCQGYSEPGAGSDLASLRTSAALDGDEWVINGQKTGLRLRRIRRTCFCWRARTQRQKSSMASAFYSRAWSLPASRCDRYARWLARRSSVKYFSMPCACRARTSWARSIKDGRWPKRSWGSSG